jgi:DNA-binding transcriptional MerR regulator
MKMTIEETKELGFTLADARDLLEAAYNEGTRINSSDSKLIAFVATDEEAKLIRDILAADHSGKERELDPMIHKHAVAGFIGRMRSIEYSRITNERKELSQELAGLEPTAENLPRIHIIMGKIKVLENNAKNKK